MRLNSGMTQLHPMMTSAAREFGRLVRSAADDPLTEPTPCAEYDVRALVNHLLYWGPWLEAAARREPAPTETRGETGVDLVGDDWAAALEKQVNGLVAAFGLPGAWEGTTSMGGGEMPALFVGQMVFGEFVVHAWDLAKATGRPWHCDADVAAAAYDATVGMAGQAREMNVFGPEVPVPASAPALDRLLGLTGRDPAWTP
jgi:uncharacterized protein (TIGR03086 family)